MGCLCRRPLHHQRFRNLFQARFIQYPAPQHQQQPVPFVTDNLLTGAAGSGFDELNGRILPAFPVPWDTFGETEPPDQPMKIRQH